MGYDGNSGVKRVTRISCYKEGEMVHIDIEDASIEQLALSLLNYESISVIHEIIERSKEVDELKRENKELKKTVCRLKSAASSAKRALCGANAFVAM